MIRKAKPSDADAIVSLAEESVSIDPLPVKNDTASMKVTTLAAMNPAHFCMVSEIDGEVVAAFVAMAQKSFWFKGLAVSILLYYTRVPGEGIKLIREFARWVKSRSGIKTAVIEMEPGVDPRLVQLMIRLGFSRQTQNLTYVREPV